jgi:hypothetical protein
VSLVLPRAEAEQRHVAGALSVDGDGIGARHRPNERSARG